MNVTMLHNHSLRGLGSYRYRNPVFTPVEGHQRHRDDAHKGEYVESCQACRETKAKADEYTSTSKGTE